MRTISLLLFAFAATAAGGAVLLSPALELTPADQARPAPHFTQRRASAWVNTPPLSWEQLRGNVTLVEFWTFLCANCEHTLPWLQTLEPRYGARGLRIVGIHTPELPQEYDPIIVARKVKELGIRYPVMIDNDHAYWSALHNQYWPAFYLVDAQGRVRASFIGETHAGDANALAIEQSIETLLLEK